MNPPNQLPPAAPPATTRMTVPALYALLETRPPGSMAACSLQSFRQTNLYGVTAALDLVGATVRLAAWDVSAGSSDSKGTRPVLRLGVHQGIVYLTLPKHPVLPTDTNRINLPNLERAVANVNAYHLNGYCATYLPSQAKVEGSVWRYLGALKDTDPPVHNWKLCKVDDEPAAGIALGLLRAAVTGRSWGYER